MNDYAEPDHEEDEIEVDPEVDEHMDPGIRMKPPRHEEDEEEELG